MNCGRQLKINEMKEFLALVHAGATMKHFTVKLNLTNDEVKQHLKKIPYYTMYVDVAENIKKIKAREDLDNLDKTRLILDERSRLDEFA